jgi:uncharacterized repeat protein (TIGR01451 family)
MLFAFLMIGLNATSLADPLGIAFASGAKPAAVAAPANAASAAVAAPANAAPAAVPTGKSTIGDYVWHDFNLDGFHYNLPLPDEDEYLAGFNGVKVNLYLKDPVSGLWGLITTTLTGDNPNMVGTQTGWYEFNVTADGSQYRVEIDASNFNVGQPLNGYVNTSALTYGQGIANRIEMFLPGLVEVNLDGDFGYARAGIIMVKTAGNAADGATYYINAPSASVTYTYRYTNTGETYLTSIVITDDAGTPANTADDFACVVSGTLAPGASGTCTSATKTLTGDRTNIGYASGTPASNSSGDGFPGPNPSDTDDAIVDMVNPGINVVKVAGTAADGATYFLNTPGGSVTYVYTVTNTGDVPLINVKTRVTDDKCASVNYASGDTNNNNRLETTETWRFTCTTNITIDTVNTATAIGTPSTAAGVALPGVPDVNDTDQAIVDIVAPGINVVKVAGTAADGATYFLNAPGGSVTYVYTVTNTGDVPLINVKTRVTDDKCSPVNYASGDANSNNILETTETWRFTCTTNITVDTTNTATTIGTPSTAAGVALPGVPDVNDTDQAIVDIVNPRIVIAKTPDLQQVGTGTMVTFTIQVTNTGDVRLNNVSVGDVVAPNCVRANLGFLIPGATVSYTCNMTPTVTVTNIATTTGIPADTSGVPMPGVPAPTAQDDAVVQVLTTGIDLVKTAGSALDGQTLTLNQAAPVSVTYTYRITNTGTSYLKNITVTDDKIGAVCTPALLAPGATTTCTKTANITADVTNIGTATGTPSNAASVTIPGLANPTDTDQAKVEFRGSIGDWVWWDANNNGLQDAGEPGILGVVVVLTPTVGSPVSVTTNATGYYSFTNLLAGNYTVGIPRNVGDNVGFFAAGWYPTNPATGVTTTVLGYGQVIATVDFGLNIPTSYTLTKTLNTPVPVRTGSAITYTIRITNTGNTWLTVLPMRDVYSTTYLAYGYNGSFASPASNNNTDDGLIDWSDLTLTRGDVGPGASVSVIVTFTAKADTTKLPGGKTDNVAEVHDAVAQYVRDEVSGASGSDPAFPLPDKQDDAPAAIILPTGLSVTGLQANAQGKDVTIVWQTANEAQILGFDVLRKSSPADVKRVNPEMIAAEHAGSSAGTTYSFTDRGLAPGVYTYVLRVIKLDGTMEQLEAKIVTVKP